MLDEIIKTLEGAIMAELEKGLDHINTEEMYKVADIYKDFCEAKYYHTMADKKS